ncbi:MAG: type IV secretion system protein [Proteobacteria bacterium]|nr:type IV secretion system protein [Pseudomonadota bacterium]
MNTVEPPVLMSRIMMFVFAAAIATAVGLVVAITEMFPLAKTQIFMLTTNPRENIDIRVASFSPSDANIETYLTNFVKEYVKLRNEVIPYQQYMQRRWGSDENGSVHVMSADDVYSAFANTRLFYEIMSTSPNFSLRCSVEFTNVQLYTTNADDSLTYEVNFRHVCNDNTGQRGEKDYTIRITIRPMGTVKWAERLTNPLGVYVSEYTVVAGGDDPLNLTQ